MEAPQKITRKRSRESGAERRSKDRERKRRKRAAPATAPVVDNSSSSDEGNLQELPGNDHAEAHLFESDLGAASWLRSQRPDLAGRGNRGEKVPNPDTGTTESTETEQPGHSRASPEEEGATGYEEQGELDQGFSNISVDFPEQANEASLEETRDNVPGNTATTNPSREDEGSNGSPQGIRAHSILTE